MHLEKSDGKAGLQEAPRFQIDQRIVFTSLQPEKDKDYHKKGATITKVINKDDRHAWGDDYFIKFDDGYEVGVSDGELEALE